MNDRIDRLDHTTFQHGPDNDRVYVLGTVAADLPQLLPYLENLASKRGYGKVIAKCPDDCEPAFRQWGARREASIGEYYGPGRDAVFMARYFDDARLNEDRPEEVADNLALARARAGAGFADRDAAWDEVSVCAPEDAEAMSAVYREVFPTYPFPIHDPVYLRQAMQNDVVFFKLTRDGAIGALASAEMDTAHRAVEMTDFATLPALRGQGAAQGLLEAMETTMAARGIRTTFTIARAYSAGMNITFSRAGYRYGGTLTSNTNIGGGIESMNVWWKPLAAGS